MEKQFKRSRLSWYKQERLLEYFIAGSTARCAAQLLSVNHKTAAFYFHRLREIIAYELEQESAYFFSGEIEVDESYFGAKGKTPVFGLLKRGGKVYTKVIPDAKGETLIPIIEEKVIPDSIVYSDSWRGYNALDVSDFKHMRINHNEVFAEHENHINGIENFWNQAKRHMRKFNGIPKENFMLYLKECEWRFNHCNFKTQKKQLKQWAKKHLG